MQFIRSSALLREARREEVVGREDRVAAMEWLRIYDEALDGRVDGGFFDFQVEASLGMTIDHPFSLQTQKTEGMHRLLSRMFLEGPPLQATPREYLVSGDRALIRGQQREEPSFWEIGLMVLLSLTPLTWAGCESRPLDCSDCPKGLCYEGTQTTLPDATDPDGDGDAALSTDADAAQTVNGIICGCPPGSYEATCLPEMPGGKTYPCCVSETMPDDNH